MIKAYLTAALPLCALAAMPPVDRLPLGDISRTQLDSFARLSTASASFDPNQRPLAFLSSTALGADAQNDILNATCKPVTLLFARGTTEQGNMGTLVGPPFAQALGKAIGTDNLAVQGVDYDATVEGFFAGGDPEGSKTMAGLVAMSKSNCANTTLVLAGYDQGAQLIHNAASMLSADEASSVIFVMFGDPNNGQAIDQVLNAKTFCRKKDTICAGNSVVNEAHLTYRFDVGDAVAFILKSGLLPKMDLSHASSASEEENPSDRRP